MLLEDGSVVQIILVVGLVGAQRSEYHGYVFSDSITTLGYVLAFLPVACIVLGVVWRLVQYFRGQVHTTS